MPKFKEPRSLQKLALETLGTNVIRQCQEAIDAIGSGRTAEINVNSLRNYLYGDLPSILSHEVTVHMLLAVRRLLTNDETSDDCGNTDVKIIKESIILACVYPEIIVLDMYDLPVYDQRILSCNIQTFEKLHTIIFSDSLPIEVVETLPIGLSSLKYLVDFWMQCSCTDVIINALGSSCSGTLEHINVNYSKNVTDASFKIFMKCHKLRHLSICCTSVTAEGYVQYLQSIRQSDDKAKGFLHVGVGSWNDWDISSTQLNEISITCPMLKQLEICELRGDMGMLVCLMALEELEIRGCDFYQSNMNGFLRLKGSNIISLELDNTDFIDLTCIMRNCINIRKLFVLGGCIMDIPLGNTGIEFRKLEVLELNCWFSTSSIELMLYACVNMTLLCLVPRQEDITDELILRLLSNNPLQKLKSLSAASTKITMKSVHAVIEHCALLEELDCMNCYAITDTEINSLRQKIKDQNQDLRVFFRFY